MKPARLWNEARRAAYARNNYHCWACGVYVRYDTEKLRFDNDENTTLDAHEFYYIDYDNKVVELVEIVALCKLCHNYIHSGRYQSMWDDGKIDNEDIWTVKTHGDSILIDNGFVPCFEHDEKTYKDEWHDWKLIFNGNEYFSPWKDYWDWYKNYKIG